MNTMLIANNITSIAASLACWWLAHTYASAGYPYGRIIAGMWGALGLSLLITAFARNVYIDPSPFLVITKGTLAILCVAIARRVTLNARQLRRLRHEHPGKAR